MRKYIMGDICYHQNSGVLTIVSLFKSKVTTEDTNALYKRIKSKPSKYNEFYIQPTENLLVTKKNALNYLKRIKSDGRFVGFQGNNLAKLRFCTSDSFPFLKNLPAINYIRTYNGRHITSPKLRVLTIFYVEK